MRSPPGGIRTLDSSNRSREIWKAAPLVGRAGDGAVSRERGRCGKSGAGRPPPPAKRGVEPVLCVGTRS